MVFNFQESVPSSCRSSFMSETPRGSWASSVFDLRNSMADPLIPNLLDHVLPETTEAENEAKRQETRQVIKFFLFWEISLWCIA